MPCDSPFFVQVKGRDVPVPCDKCPPCKIRRVNEWVFRLMWEERYNSVSSHFVTLTYDTHHVPLSPNGFMTLRKSDFQNYMKRLRKLCVGEGPSLKYYACGEYGSQTMRPHFHAIVLNCPDSELFAKAWSLDGVEIGSVVVGSVSSDSIAYCMKYIDKQSFDRRSVQFARDDRVPEFSLKSQGLGAGYCEDEAILAYHRRDLSRNFVTKLSGYRVAMPRYYRKRIFSEEELEEQRFLIQSDLISKTLEDMRLHDDLQYSYAQKLEHERNGRKTKFEYAQKRRNGF